MITLKYENLIEGETPESWGPPNEEFSVDNLVEFAQKEITAWCQHDETVAGIDACPADYDIIPLDDALIVTCAGAQLRKFIIQ